MFKSTFLNVLLALLYMIPGFALCKMGKARPKHLSTMSAILIYFCTPCMILSAFLKLPKSQENLINMGLFFVFSLFVQTLFFLILLLILRKKHEKQIYRLLNVGSVLGNVGFFGMPLISAVFPDHPEVSCYSSMYVVGMNILVFTIGVYCVTGDKKAISFKNAFINPAFGSFLVVLPVYIFGLGRFVPSFLQGGIEVVARMTTPLCMLILGIRLASVEMKKLWTNPLQYLTVGLKLVVFPLFSYGLSLLFPFPDIFRYSILILAGTPCASVLLAMAEMHGKGEEAAANCILLSVLLCIITLPLLALLIR